MSLKLPPDRTDAISAAVRNIARRVEDATLAPDTGALAKALNEVWFATHEAQTLVRNAEQATRDEALAKLGEAA